MEYAAVSSAGMLTDRRFFLDYYYLGTVPTAKLTRNRHAYHPCAYHEEIARLTGHTFFRQPSMFHHQ
jgi:uncharacterized protein YcbX